MNKQVLLKFLKGAITGGLTAVSASLVLGVPVKSLDDLKGMVTILAVAFASGAIHAIVELLSPTVPATIVSSTVESKTVTQPTTPTTPVS